MNFKLSPLASDIIISVYIVLTLAARLLFEHMLMLSPVASIFIGLGFILLVAVFIKVKILNPNWFGLFNKK